MIMTEISHIADDIGTRHWPQRDSRYFLKKDNVCGKVVSMRIGMGYDVHRLVEGRDLIIGGVKIPYEKGLLGHSDADVLLHAIMDALLGGFAVGGGLLLIVLLYEKVRQKEAMGGGDIKLLFLTGLFLGWQRNILCLLIACVLGIVFAFIFPEKRTTEDGAEEEDGKLFPWGPSISAAAILTLLCGSEIIGVYLSLF